MNYISPKYMVVSSTSGNSVEFKKGIPTYAPPGMHEEIIAAGIRAETEVAEPEPVDGPVEPKGREERKEALHAAFKKVSLRNSRDDFNAVGIPHTAVLARELGWSVNAKERDAAWSVWQQEGVTA